ncbi:hypothetical protein Q9L42_014870 [Methylomarinum sp. Ch1-1]|uniref:Uncharacterized protein n=1 Tax=Methylomarinum roseum TaxID=3067653 RepID=A0AAU7NRP0_9GAMM|nr:hypothetical protein [Methylomarinum sp. Ch1-1]MDP4520392.1 hypothetical protein [Methylomarinum sp. Ch1-1]
MEIRLKKYLLSLLVLLSSQSNLRADVVRENALPNVEPVLLNELDEARGRGGVVDVTTLNKMSVGAYMADNVAVNNTNGFNMIDNGSFAGSSGFISVIQNTGNQVIIQDSTIVNVTITP